jgi:hypothetical protein
VLPSYWPVNAIHRPSGENDGFAYAPAPVVRREDEHDVRGAERRLLREQRRRILRGHAGEQQREDRHDEREGRLHGTGLLDGPIIRGGSDLVSCRFALCSGQRREHERESLLSPSKDRSAKNKI